MSGELMSGFIGACVVAAAGILVAGIVAFIKRRVKVTGPQAEAIALNAKHLAQIQPLVAMLVAIQKPQLIALLGIIEALKEKMNGTFQRAHDGVRSALDNFDQTLTDIVTGKCQEPKA